MKEHDVVISLVQIENVLAGTKGTIVHVYMNSAAYEVEFMEEGKTIGVIRVLPDQIELI